MSQAGSGGGYNLLDTLPYMLSIAVPSAWNAPSAAMEMSEATNAYSIAFAPFSQRTIRINRIMAHSVVNKTAAGVAGPGIFLSGKLPNACRLWLTGDAVDRFGQRHVAFGHAAGIVTGQRKSTRFHTFVNSGWWSTCSACSATRARKPNASLKSLSLKVRVS